MYASWSGSTETARWRLLAGPSPTRLTAAATVPRDGFETAIEIPEAARFVAVEAVDDAGNALGRSESLGLSG